MWFLLENSLKSLKTLRHLPHTKHLPWACFIKQCLYLECRWHCSLETPLSKGPPKLIANYLEKKVLTYFFTHCFKQFLTHLLTHSSIPLPRALLFIPLMRGRLISIISPSTALLMHGFFRGRTVTLWWQWQRSSGRWHGCSGLKGSLGYSDLHKSLMVRTFWELKLNYKLISASRQQSSLF